MKASLVAVPMILAGAVFEVLYRLGRGYGAEPAERAAALPGDDLVPGADVVCTHATTINAPPLCQPVVRHPQAARFSES